MDNDYQKCLDFLCKHAMEYVSDIGENGFVFIDEYELNEYKKPLQKLIDMYAQDESNKECCKDCSHCTNWWKDEYVYQLENLLNKACDELSSMEYKLNMSKNPLSYDCDYKDRDEWKEWLYND